MDSSTVSWREFKVGGSRPAGRVTFLIRVHPETPDGHDISFRIGNEEFFVGARKSRTCAEAYTGTPHKQDRRLTPPWRKSTVSGRKLIRLRRETKRARAAASITVAAGGACELLVLQLAAARLWALQFRAGVVVPAVCEGFFATPALLGKAKPGPYLLCHRRSGVAGAGNSPANARSPKVIGCGVEGLCAKLRVQQGLRSQIQTVQSAVFSPGTRWNSLALFVTKVTSRETAWAAISRSMAPMGVPAFSRAARISP